MTIITHKKIFLGLGVVVSALCVLLIGILGLKLGIDFTGGSLTEVVYTQAPEQEEIEALLPSEQYGASSVRHTVDTEGREGYLLRLRDLSETERQTLAPAITALGEGGEVTRFTSIGPSVGEELKDKAVWAIGLVSLVIIFYVAFAFRGVREPVGSWVYGIVTIIVLLHDVLIPTALMALLGAFAGVEIDVLFVMAILAVLGYSVNDTIVVFDRVRENVIKYRQEKKRVEKDEFNQPREVVEYIPTKPFAEIVEESVQQTIGRSVNTSFTTALALGALLLLGAAVTKTFALVLLAGVLAGTYSSIFLASPLLVWIAERKHRVE